MYVARQDAKLLDWHIYRLPFGVYTDERRICGASCEAVARETAALLNDRMGVMA